jgi:DNA-binding PadR family transcriptional regulator
MKENARGTILRILSTPATVTEIKNKAKNIESFGTIAYHLAKLEKESIVEKVKDHEKRGRPTTYSLVDKKLIEFYKERKKNEIIARTLILKKIKEQPLITDDELMAYVEKSGLEEYALEEIFGCSNAKLSTISYKITPKGAKFLKENSK